MIEQNCFDYYLHLIFCSNIYKEYIEVISYFFVVSYYFLVHDKFTRKISFIFISI